MDSGGDGIPLTPVTGAATLSSNPTAVAAVSDAVGDTLGSPTAVVANDVTKPDETPVSRFGPESSEKQPAQPATSSKVPTTSTRSLNFACTAATATSCVVILPKSTPTEKQKVSGAAQSGLEDARIGLFHSVRESVEKRKRADDCTRFGELMESKARAISEKFGDEAANSAMIAAQVALTPYLSGSALLAPLNAWSGSGPSGNLGYYQMWNSPPVNAPTASQPGSAHCHDVQEQPYGSPMNMPFSLAHSLRTPSNGHATQPQLDQNRYDENVPGNGPISTLDAAESGGLPRSVSPGSSSDSVEFTSL